MSVGYTKEDKEIQSFTSTGIAVITGDDQGKTILLQQPPLNDNSLNSSSPLMACEKSDDEDSDHGDAYGQHMKGRVSPSPYTANTERARQFNAYVRNLIEEKLDILIPISHQPRELVQQIMADSNDRFPEFSSSVRKRIRTYLKSYRRSRRVKDMQAAAALATTYHSNGLPSNNGSKERPPIMDEPVNVSAIALPSNVTFSSSIPGNTSAVVTINNPRNVVDEEAGPETKKRRVGQLPMATAPIPPPAPPLTTVVNSGHTPAANTPSGQGLSNTEIGTLKQLIQGYRESAIFLNRAADQLEELITKDSAINV